jgi:pimeloyl-ACP methyl ester carboxylesterase
MRKHAFGAVLSCAAVLTASPAIAADVTGVAFVHGTGSQTNAYNDYWQPTMVNNVRNGLANPANYVVINCDFNQYMWDSRAAGCLAGQLTTFINAKGITRLIVITHSNGGNVVRWIMSNPTYDSRYPNIINKIIRVNALAPSSAGTPLADATINGNVFETSLGWLLGYKSDAVRMQQVSWMASYNANNLYGTSGRPALPKLFRSVVGTDVDSASLGCRQLLRRLQLENVGLETTQNWLNSCSDGFLQLQQSKSAAGSVWFHDTDAHGRRASR